MTTYLAFTIGPIYKTMMKASKTREVWMSSYFFSSVMEQLFYKAKQSGKIILPAEPAEKLKTGAGIYPDRLIMSLSNNNIKVEDEIIKPVIEKCAEELSIDVEPLTNYLQIYFVKITDAALLKFELKDKHGKHVTSFIHRLNFLLDNKELNANYTPSNETFFESLFGSETRGKFYKKAFKNKRHEFPSIIEISANNKVDEEILELSYKDSLTPAETLAYAEALSKKNLSTVHKYIAILRADGDNFGGVIASLGNDVDEFSKKLVKFSEVASQKIAEYGGTVIYIGGDDILCFAPVENKGQTVFSLVNILNTEFKNIFSDEVYVTNKVSLSYGLSITYYKYPLNEALDLSYKLLFYTAKKTPTKNCLAYQVLQHSGQFRETIIEFGEQYDSFLTMLNQFDAKDEMLQSLTHAFVEDRDILNSILVREDNEERLNSYFENHFSIEEKKQQASIFIDAVKTNTKSTLKTIKTDLKISDNNEIKSVKADQTLNQINTICRTLKFLLTNEQQ